MGLTNVWQFDAASWHFAALISSWCIQHWRFGLWECYASFCFEEGKKTCFENVSIGELFGGTWSCPPPYKTKPYRTSMKTSWKSHGNKSFIFLLHHWNPLILSQCGSSPGLIDYWLRCPIASLLLIEFFWKLSTYTAFWKYSCCSLKFWYCHM